MQFLVFGREASVHVFRGRKACHHHACGRVHKSAPGVPVNVVSISGQDKSALYYQPLPDVSTRGPGRCPHGEIQGALTARGNVLASEARNLRGVWDAVCTAECQGRCVFLCGSIRLSNCSCISRWKEAFCKNQTGKRRPRWNELCKT